MTSSWSVVGYNQDPVPGNPDEVQGYAGDFRRTAQTLEQAATALQRMESGDNRSDAIAQLIVNSREVAEVLKHVQHRYQVAGDALAAFSPALRDAQEKARAALQAGQSARAQYNNASNNAETAYQQARGATDPVQQDNATADFYRYKSGADDAQSHLNNAKAQVAQAIQDRDAAANIACAAIKMVNDDPALKDGWREKLEEVFDDLEKLAKDVYNLPGLKQLIDLHIAVIKFVWDHIEDISFALSLLVLVPGLGEVVAPFYAASKVLVAVKLGIKLAGDVAHGLREHDWKPLLTDGAAAAVSFVVGKSIGRVTGKVANKALQGPLDQLYKKSFKEEGVIGTLETVAPAFEKAVPSKLQKLVPSTIQTLIANPMKQPGAPVRVIDRLVAELKESPEGNRGLMPIRIDAATIQADRLLANRLIHQTIDGTANWVDQNANLLVMSGASPQDASTGSPQ